MIYVILDLLLMKRGKIVRLLISLEVWLIEVVMMRKWIKFKRGRLEMINMIKI